MYAYCFSYIAIYDVVSMQCGSADSKEDFLREIAVMTTFVHPNIVRVYGSVDKGKDYML